MPRPCIPELLDSMRAGHLLSGAQIRALVDGIGTGDLTDAQVGAFAMAVCWRGLDPDGLIAMCDAMIRSGDRLSWNVGRPVVDKHSTGGVGDKISLILAPLLAAAGCAVPMLSGRGLGHTGGTLDKLESIPGFCSSLNPERAREILEEVGCFIAGAGPTLVPADARLYGIRDITGTVASPHLIATSIMSKKIAGGADALVVDIKVGSGAFCRTSHVAAELAELMSHLATWAGIAFDAAFSPMSAPLGLAVGNACEVTEARDVLSGGGPDDVVHLTVEIGERLCALGGVDIEKAELRELLHNGAALDVFNRMIAAQGGDPAAPLPEGRHRKVLRAIADGYVHFDAAGIGSAAWRAGAGRARPGERVDHSAGVLLAVPEGAVVSCGQDLCTITSSDPDRLDAAVAVADRAIQITSQPAPVEPLSWWST